MSFPPVYDSRSRLLILGTYPSPRSRAEGFYYGHPRNRFWHLLSGLLGMPFPADIPARKQLLLNSGIALWDVCGSCEVEGASDASIRQVIPNHIPGLLRETGITRIYCNGVTAGKLYAKHILPITGIPATVLPSTSPANAQWTQERLTEAWRCILELPEGAAYDPAQPAARQTEHPIRS